jgi:hypothetical protein
MTTLRDAATYIQKLPKADGETWYFKGCAGSLHRKYM